MRKVFASLVLICFLAIAFPACDTQKPAEEVKDAQDRVEQKVLDARSGQDDPALQEEAGSLEGDTSESQENPFQ